MPEETETVAGIDSQEQNTQTHKESSAISSESNDPKSKSEDRSKPGDASQLLIQAEAGNVEVVNICPEAQPVAELHASAVTMEDGKVGREQSFQITEEFVESAKPRESTPEIVETSEQAAPNEVEPSLIAVESPAQPEPETPVNVPNTIAISPSLPPHETSPPTDYKEELEACKLGVGKQPDVQVQNGEPEKPQVLNGTIANELKTEDYRLPDVVEVKKNFEYIEPVIQNGAPPPKKGALLTSLDTPSVRQAYEDVRFDGSETDWAVFKFNGSQIVTSAKGSDFSKFKKEFGDEERAFGYIRVQTGDEMSKRQKFLLVTWVGPSVSVLKRAKMSIDKSVIKGVVSNFAVELQTENIADIDLQNFQNELDKAGGAHYGTGIRS